MLSYSVVIPAYNEERFLPRTLEKLFEAMASIEPLGEVVVVDNNSSDRTGPSLSSKGMNIRGFSRVVMIRQL